MEVSLNIEVQLILRRGPDQDFDRTIQDCRGAAAVVRVFLAGPFDCRVIFPLSFLPNWEETMIFGFQLRTGGIIQSENLKVLLKKKFRP